MISASIVLLLKNAERYLPDLLDAIFQQECDFKFEVIAIDSGSKDATIDILKKYPVKLTQIPPATFNHGETRNLGARLADPQAEFIVYLTQDALPADNHWLECLLSPLQEDARAAGTFSRHLPRPNSSPSMVRQLTTVWQSGGANRLVKEMPASREEYERNKFHYVFFSNTSSAIRKEVWRKFPWKPVSFAEDAVWADEVIRAGYNLIYEPESAVIHSHDYSIVEQFRQTVDHTYAMKILFNPPDYQSEKSWFRQFRAIPRQVWRDWFFIWHSPYCQGASPQNKMGWMVFSPWWQLASSLGAYIGAHLDRYPPRMRVFLSRQERIRQQ